VLAADVEPAGRLDAQGAVRAAERHVEQQHGDGADHEQPRRAVSRRRGPRGVSR
jgi:hypothetical protein